MSMIWQFFPKYLKTEYIDDIVTESFTTNQLLPVFDKESIDFLNEISRKIFAGKTASSYPELAALAFFLRKSSIIELKNKTENSLDNSTFLSPRGIAFHIAPSNVDTIFVYSWALSLLAGNLNIVRISSKINPQVQILLDIIKNIAESSAFVHVSERNILLNYEHDKSINDKLSSIADMRIIWGGNETISLIRSSAAKPVTKEIAFADKVSYSVIDSGSYLEFDEKSKENLSAAFYNDGYYFGQMGCSSPRIVYFSGTDAASEKASVAFWENLSEFMRKKSHSDDISVALNKHIEIFEKAAGDVNILAFKNMSDTEPTVVRIDKESAGFARETCGGGFFYECFISSIDDLIPLVQQNDQTMTYAGFVKDKLKDFALKVNGKGIDRIVPIGNALAFAPVWDGYNLMLELTKSISIL